ncbi:MAG: hypothetical protein Q9162_000454 [Coniocarpon cinnabarinum]
MAAVNAPNNLVALSLTNVYYNPDDLLSHTLAYLTLTPQLLFAVYLTTLYTTREIEIALMFAGQLGCEALNVLLKRWFKELRPALMRELHRGYGMPSSHAQFVSFFAIYAALFLVVRHVPSVRVVEEQRDRTSGSEKSAENRRRKGKREGSKKGDARSESEREGDAGREEGQSRAKTRKRKASVVINGVERPLDPTVSALMNGEMKTNGEIHSEEAASPAYSIQLHHPKLTHTALTVAGLVMAVVVAGSRVYLQYHTLKQVLAGFAAGSVFAAFWFCVTEWLRRTGWVEWTLDLTLVRSMRVRDLVCEEDLVEIGWQVWEDKRRRRKALRHAKVTRNVKDG